ncbi:MAG: DUF4038 domain-containing protein [Gammaproteobacteria bacterium]
MNSTLSFCLAALFALLGNVSSTHGANYSVGKELAVKFGVHEIVLTGDGALDNPFDTITTVKFSPPSGEKNAKTVHVFYDGGNTWRARVYVSETGEWKWTSRCDSDKGLNDKTGTFTGADSKLRGRLLPHPKNPRHWTTEDGRWFLNLNDTAYFLLSPHTAIGEPVKDDDVKAYVRDAVERGVTSVRCFTLIGPGGYLEDGKNFAKRWRDSAFDDDAFTRMRLPHFRVADDRLRWLLDEYPDLYVQFILFPRGSRHGQDEQMWTKFTPEQKERVMRYVLARYAAYPQLFWLVANDAHYGPKHPNNNAFAREVGEYFRRHDPWRHPMSTGHARKVEYFFGGEDWSSYIHLEDNFDLGATQYAKYHPHAKPVFLGEDRYEQDHPEDRDPMDMRYFQRRLFWSWLLAGGSANYGGRWWVVHPYTQTGTRATPSPWSVIAGGEEGKPGQAVMHTRQLTGLDSVKAIRHFFTRRKIELSDFEPDHALVNDPDVKEATRAPKLMRRGHDEFLIYHPNAAADDRNTRADTSKTPSVILDLSAAGGKFTVEWFRAADGTAQPGGVLEGGKPQTLRSPWRGQDCVVRLSRE